LKGTQHIFTCAQKLTNSQLNLLHGTEQKRVMKNQKQKQKPRGVSTQHGMIRRKSINQPIFSNTSRSKENQYETKFNAVLHSKSN